MNADELLNELQDARYNMTVRRNRMADHDNVLDGILRAIKDAQTAQTIMPGMPEWEPHPKFVEYVRNKIAEGQKI